MTFVSEKHGLVFIHVHKAAGASLAAALSAATGEPRNSYRGRALPNHVRPAALFREFAELRESFSVAILRNPWDRLVSYFHWMRGEAPVSTAAARCRQEHLRSYRRFGDYVRDLYLTFSDPARFEPHSMRYEPTTGAVNYPAQVTWLEADGERVVDYVGRFEALTAVVSHIAAATGITVGPLEHRHRAAHRPYAEYYDNETATLVGEIYRRDVELGDYRFST